MANKWRSVGWLMTVVLLASAPTWAALPTLNGSTLLRMCKPAGKVEALSVMCHSYLNGFLEATQHYAQGRYCLGEHDREHLPDDLVKWIEAHSGSQGQPAGQVLDRYLTETFPCRRK